MANPLTQLTLDQLRARTSMKWRDYPPDVLPLWVAEMDVPLAPAVTTALTEAVALGDIGYPSGTPYAEALAGFAAARWGWQIDLAAARLVPDVMIGAAEVLRRVTGDGDAVVINSPVYAPFYEFIANAGRRVVEAPLGEDHRIDLEVLEQAFVAATAGGPTAGYLLCSPHNPTGTVHTIEELTAIVALAARYGVRVVVDEIHAPLVYAEARHIPYLTVPGTDDAVALLSATKAWNLAGLKGAIAVAGPAAVEALDRMPGEFKYGASHLGVLAHSAALRDGAGWLDDLLAGLDGNRRLLANLLAEHLPAVRYRLPQATYLAWLDCRPLELPGDPAAVFLERGRVALVSGPTFGTGGEGYARINFATSPEILTEAVRRMAAAVA